MFLAHHPGAAFRLQIEQARGQRVEGQAHGAHVVAQPGAQQMAKEFVELLRIPGAIHVGFTEAQVAAGEGALGHARLAQLHVPGGAAIQMDIGPGQQLGRFAGQPCVEPKLSTICRCLL
ncbi:hypothetical protein D3C87_1210080 [compost metagenome]